MYRYITGNMATGSRGIQGLTDMAHQFEEEEEEEEDDDSASAKHGSRKYSNAV